MSAESNETREERDDEEVVQESSRAPRRHRSAPPEALADVKHEPTQAPHEEPWWHSKILVSLLAMVGASVAPTTAWLNAQQQRATEAARAANVQALQTQEQQHAVRMEFFEKVVSPTIAMTPESRLEALRYFQAVLPEGDLRKWAETEYQSLEQLLAERRKADAEREKSAAEARAAAATVDRALDELEATPTSDLERRQALTAEIETKTSEAKTQAQRAKVAERTVETLTRKVADSVPEPVRTKAAVSVKEALSATAAELGRTAFASELEAQTALLPRPQPQAQQAISAPAPLTAVEPFEVGFKAERAFLTQSKEETYYKFSVAIDAPAAALSRIARVEYLFDHPTFTNKNLSSRDRAAKFEVSYRGWGCLSEVVATITLLDGRTVRRSFDQCGAIK